MIGVYVFAAYGDGFPLIKGELLQIPREALTEGNEFKIRLGAVTHYLKTVHVHCFGRFHFVLAEVQP